MDSKLKRISFNKRKIKIGVATMKKYVYLNYTGAFKSLRFKSVRFILKKLSDSREKQDGMNVYKFSEGEAEFSVYAVKNKIVIEQVEEIKDNLEWLNNSASTVQELELDSINIEFLNSLV